MEWKDVAAQLAQMGLPLLGRVIGGQIPIIGPLLGAGMGEAIGQQVATAIATALGVKPTPAAIGRAIENGDTSEVIAKLRAVEAEAAVKWPALAEIAKSDASGEVEIARINAEASARIAADVASNGFWLSLYRSILNYAATANLIFLGCLISYGLLMGGAVLENINASKDLLQWWIGGLATILGLHFYTRGKEREAAVTGQLPAGPVGNAVKAAAGKK